LVGSAVIDDLAALCIRLTDRAPIDAARADGGAFALQDVANKLGVGVRSIQRWRRLGFVSMRFQFGRTCRVGCDGTTIKWFEMRHPEMLSKVKRSAPTQQERQRVLARARVVAASGGTLNAAAVALARAEKISVAVARRALEHLEKNSDISPLKRRIVVGDTKATVAWRSWLRGVDLNAIARRVGQTRAATLRTIAKQRLRRIQTCVVNVVPLATFQRADAAETLLAPMQVGSELAHGAWPTQPNDFLAAFAPVVHARKNTLSTDAMQLTALRFLLWHSERLALNMGKPSTRASRTPFAINKNEHKTAANTMSNTTANTMSNTTANNARGDVDMSLHSEHIWTTLDQCETSLRWAARLRLSLLQRSVGQALGRLQAIAGAPLVSLHRARMCQAIHIALEGACAVLDQCMRTPPSDRAIQLGSLAAAQAEKTAVKHWKFSARPAPGEATELPSSLQQQCVPWLPMAPLRDDLSLVTVAPSVGVEVLALRFGWHGRAPHTMNDVAKLLGIHPRRAAIIAADTLRKLVRASAQRSA
jgi:transposase-like protein